jgi:hypothetical protein
LGALGLVADLAPLAERRSAGPAHAAQVGRLQRVDVRLTDRLARRGIAGLLQCRGKRARRGVRLVRRRVGWSLLGLVVGLARCGAVVDVDAPAPRRPVDSVGRDLAAVEVRPDDLPQPRRASALRRALDDPRLVALAFAVQLDQHGRRPVATTQARDANDRDLVVAAKLGGDILEPDAAIGRATQVAGLVPADADLYVGRRLQPEMREEADDLMQPVQWHAESSGQILELGPREIPVAHLELAQFLDEHRDTQRSDSSSRGSRLHGSSATCP